MAKTKRSAKRRQRLELRLVTFTVLCLLVVASFGKLRLRQKNEAYQAKEAQLLASLEKERERTKEIENFKKYVQTKKYVEEVAKEKLGLVYENEVLFKAVD